MKIPLSCQIHPTAVIEDGAELGEHCKIGAFAYVGAKVRLGTACNVHHHATVEGYTLMGEENEIFPYACIGMRTQDLKYKGGNPGLKIGSGNRFREYCSVHPATSDGDFTIIGDGNNLLAYSHVAHDCILGNNIIMSGQNALAGHVEVGDRVIVSWGSGVTQFSRLGRHSFVGAMVKVNRDLPPFMLLDGNPAEVKTFNKVGLERSGFSSDDLQVVKNLYRLFYRHDFNRSQAIEQLQKETWATHPLSKEFLDFLSSAEKATF